MGLFDQKPDLIRLRGANPSLIVRPFNPARAVAKNINCRPRATFLKTRKAAGVPTSFPTSRAASYGPSAASPGRDVTRQAGSPTRIVTLSEHGSI